MNRWEQKAPVLYGVAGAIRSKDMAMDEATLHQAKRVAADTAGVAFGGIQTEAFQIAAELNDQLFGKGPYRVWGTDIKTSLPGAVFYNTLSVSSTDFDEGHRKAVGHPASAIVPAAFSLGEMLNSSYEEVLKSIVIGYETATRFSLARVSEKIDSYSSGRWGATGTAATASCLLDLSTEQIIHALSHAWILSPVMLGGSTDVSTGSMSKEGVAWAAQVGLQSALLAQKGFTGPYLFVDEHDDLVKEKLLAGWGDNWLINSNYFKPYACCRWLHAAVEAAALIRRKNRFNVADIKEIEIKTFGRAMDLISEKYPQNPVQAQFHLPYVVACLLENGHVLPEHFTENMIRNNRLRKLIDIITLSEEKKYTGVFPSELPSSVKIKTGQHTFYEEVPAAPWDACCPPSDEELKTKFLLQAGNTNKSLWEQLLSENITTNITLKI